MMTRFHKAAKQILTVASIRVSYKQISAVLVLLAVMMPITAPIPVWAYNLNLPPVIDDVNSPASPEPLFATSAMDFVDNLFSGGGDKKNGKKKSTSDTGEKASAADSDSKVMAKVETGTANAKPETRPEPTAPKRAVAAAPQAVELPIGELDALFTPQNNLGTPMGQTESSGNESGGSREYA